MKKYEIGALQTSALRFFRYLHGAIVRAIDSGKITAVRAYDSKGYSVVLDGKRFRLEEKQPGVLATFIREEPEALAKWIDNLSALLDFVKTSGDRQGALLATNAALLAENERLRSLLSPFEESIMAVTRDPDTLELVSSHTLKKVR